MDIQTKPKKVLLFEHNHGDTVLIRELLDQEGGDPFDLLYCDRLSAGIEYLRMQGFDVVLLDPSLPDSQGLEAVTQVNQHAQLIPIIVITSLNDDSFAKQTIQEGAQDYVVKSKVNGKILWRIIDYSIERKKLESALRESEQKYFVLVNEAPDPIIYLNADGKITAFNLAAERISGYAAQEIVGKCFLELDLLTPRSLNKAIEDFSSVAANKESLIQEYEMIRKDKSVLILEANPRLDIKEGKIVGAEVVFRDLTERRKLEAQLWQAQKMEAIGRLSGGIAHYFNNLLCVIAGYTEFLLTELNEKDHKYEEISEIKKATDRAVDLTQQLLSFGRRQIVNPKVVDLNHLILNMEKMVRKLIGKNIEFVTLAAPDLGMVKADPRQIEQVLVNFILNAQDAMPAGGKLTIETSNVTLSKEGDSKEDSLPAGEYILLSVSDTGQGMDSETQSHIFEPFFTTKGTEQRVGLGLSTSYGIIKQSGGTLEVSSEIGKGSAFKIYFPRVTGGPEEIIKIENTKELPRGTETVLLVEDEDAVKRLAKQILKMQGYTVIEASNGEEALRLARDDTKGPIHLLVTDMVMPQMGGQELCKKMQAVHPGMKVLFMSGYSEAAAFPEDNSAMADHFLQKPFTLSSMAVKVREVLDLS